MSLEKAKAHLESVGFGDRVMEFDTSSATVELAAQAVGCEPGMIAKTLSFDVDGRTVLILFAGDARTDNSKYKAQFHKKATMLPFDQVEARVGHAVGGVCPFGVNDGVEVYLDLSLKKYPVVYPAAGSANSAVRLSIDELEKASGSQGWIDVSK